MPDGATEENQSRMTQHMWQPGSSRRSQSNLVPALWMLLAALAALSIGCGKRQPARMTVYPVSGKLLMADKPAERAEISLWPVVPFEDERSRSTLPYGLVRADGTFSIGTYGIDDGAPPGGYAVTVTWPVVTINGGEESIGPDRLRGAFRDPNKPIIKFNVTNQDNVIPTIDLSTVARP
jgi:hypothetical protein